MVGELLSPPLWCGILAPLSSQRRLRIACIVLLAKEAFLSFTDRALIYSLNIGFSHVTLGLTFPNVATHTSLRSSICLWISLDNFTCSVLASLLGFRLRSESFTSFVCDGRGLLLDLT